MAYDVLLIVHVVTSTMWVGGVFMASLIDWPAMKSTLDGKKFPFSFVVSHGRQTFFWVYFAFFGLLVSGVGMILSRPLADEQLVFLVPKIIALAIMGGFTLYGTFITWPKLQLAVDKDAFSIYQVYIYRAQIIFVLGLVSIVMGLRL